MTSQLFVQFAISTLMLLGCVVIHGAGLASLSHALRTEASIERLRRIKPLSPHGMLFTIVIVISLIALHGIEIWAFALLFMALGAIPGVEDSLYYSTISYSTVGYSDTHIAPQWRLLGAFESILGMILLGWSTAFFFRMLGRIDAH